MGGRKFRLSTHRKNEERKQRQKRTEQTQICLTDSSSPCLTVSLPISMYHEGTVTKISSLSSRLLSSHCVPSAWIVARQTPLLLCKLSTQHTTASLSVSLSVQDDFSWTVTVGNQSVTSDLCPLLAAVPDKLASASAVCKLLCTIDDAKYCPGNSEPRFLDQWRQRSLTLHGHSGMLYRGDVLNFTSFLSSGEKVASVDTSFEGMQSLRHCNCQRLLESDFKSSRCGPCTSLRATLRAQGVRQMKDSSGAMQYVNLR